MSLQEDLKDLFSFTRSERNGVIVLSSIILIVFTANILYLALHKEPDYDYSAFQKEIDSFEAQKIPITENQYENRLNKTIIERYDSLKLFDFDPNDLNEETGLKLGMTEKQIKTILNYINRGGRFYDKDDFRKMYGIRQKQFELLSPYIKLKTSGNDKGKSKEKGKTNIQYNDSLFAFDPNKTTAEEWKKLGFNEKQTATIQNYTSKGGKFKSADDLKKIYGIKTEQFEKVKDYITISAEQKPEKIIKSNFVDLNNDGIEKLKSYGGFWMYNAEKIVKYRTALGGFVNKSQLYELYGIKKEYVDKITDSIFIDLSKIVKIRINFADTEEFAIHPYLSGQNAKDIIEYRDKNGPFGEVKMLRESKIISETTYNSVKPYLTEK